MADNEQNLKIVVDYQTAMNNLKIVETELKALKNEQKQLSEEVKKGTLSEIEYNTQLATVKNQIKLKSEELKQATKEVKTITSLNKAEEGSLVALRTQYISLAKSYDTLSEAEQKSGKGTQMLQHMKNLSDEMINMDTASGRYSQNIGNYASAFTPLQLQIQQVVRDLPLLTGNTQQFFSEVASKIPMLAQAILNAKAANTALKSEGIATVPVWKQVVGAFTSWQSILVAGVSLLSTYGKELGGMVTNLIKGGPEVQNATDRVNNINQAIAQNQSIQKQITELRVLSQTWIQLGDNLDAKKRFIQDNAAALQRLGIGISSVNQVETALTQNTDKYIQALLAREKANLAMEAAVKANANADKARQEMKNGPTFWQSASIATLATITGGAYNIGSWYKSQTSIMNAETQNTNNHIQDATKYLTEYSNVIQSLGQGANTQQQSQWSSTMNARIQTAKDEANAQKQLQLELLQESAEYNNAIVNDESMGYQARSEALQRYTEITKNQIQLSADNEIQSLIEQKAAELNLDANKAQDRLKIEQLCANQIAVIRNKANKEMLDTDKEHGRKEMQLQQQIQNELIDLMEEGPEKEMAKLNLLYAQKLKAAQGQPELLEKTEQWYERESAQISPEGKLTASMTEASRNYELQMDLIDQLEIKEDEKAKKRLEAELTFRKELAKTFEEYIKTQYASGQLSEEEYKEAVTELGNMYNEAADLQTKIDKGSSDGKPNNFIQKFFGIDTSTKEGKAQWKAKKKEIVGQTEELAKQIVSANIEYQKQQSQRQLKEEQKRIDEGRNAQLKSLETKYSKGLLSEKKYNKAVEAVNAEADKKKEEAQKAAFEREKQLNLKQAIINTALSVAKTLATYAWPVSLFPAAMAAALGAVQIATIARQQYAQGGIIPIGTTNGLSMGIVQGPAHSQGGIPLLINGSPVNAEVEGGEILAVINKRSAAQYLPLLSTINASHGIKFANGGTITTGWSLPAPAPLPPSNGQLFAQLSASIEAMRIDFNNGITRSTKATLERVDNIKVHVLEKDITKAQKKVNKIKTRATIMG